MQGKAMRTVSGDLSGKKYPFDEHAIVSELLDESFKGAMEEHKNPV